MTEAQIQLSPAELAKITKKDVSKLSSIEKNVANALFDLETTSKDLREELAVLQFCTAKEVEVSGNRKAIVIFVPVPLLKSFHIIQQRLVRELEKRFSNKHVLFIAQRRIIAKPKRNQRLKQKRPISYTLTAVHEAILEDLVFPTEIVGKRKRQLTDGKTILKVFLDAKDANSLDYKLDSFSAVYTKLTGRQVVFEFPIQQQEPL